MVTTRQTVQHRREIIDAAIGAAQARCGGRADAADAYVEEASGLFRRQSAGQSGARHLFNETYRKERAQFEH